jgi:hypothetical protein
VTTVDERPAASAPVGRNVTILEHLVERAKTEAAIASLLARNSVLDVLRMIEAVDETARGMDLS